jgi:gliding motility-associated-like protein
MHRNRIISFFILLIIAKIAVAQIPVDTINIQINRDVATFKLRCIAQKVHIDAGDTTITNFNLSDTVNGEYTFDWGGDVMPDTDNLPRADYRFAVAGMYTIELSVYEDTTGTTFTNSVVVPINDIIRVPNVFTPNNDNVNDLFVVRANGIDVIDITIFSRTGTQVFTSKSPIIVWDGHNGSGSKVSPGVYYYVLTSESPNIDPQNGFIHIFYEKDK